VRDVRGTAIVDAWGSSAAERSAAYPCDALIDQPDGVVFRALDVDAPAALVFRWFCQLRVAPYSYDWIDNLGRRSPRRLIPGLEQLEVGQRFMTIFRLVAFATDRCITLDSTTRVFGQVAATYSVVPIDADRSRVVVKASFRTPRGVLGWLTRRVLPAGDLVMMRKQLRTLKVLAERDARAAATPGSDPSTRRSRSLGRFHNDTARRRYLAAYDSALAAWPTPPTEIDVATRFGGTHVVTAGPTSGAPIVLIHAVAVASPSWFPNIAALAERHPVYAIDTIGDVGRTTQTSPVRSGEDLALWLDEAFAALDLRGAHLVGLSYGGWVALNQARRAPERLASVTAVDPIGAIGRPQGTFLVKIAPDSALAAFAKSDPALHRVLRRLNNGTTPDEPLLELSIAGLRTFRAKQPYPKQMSDGDLREIHIPALVLFCERSPVNHLPQAAQRSRRLIAHATVEVVSGVGHMLPVEQPELFNSRVLKFIHDVDSPGTADPM
jgi:pimeloyl-ACP methyl ester carboxylesterase